jgi:uncharacterized protein DUF3313
MKYASVGAVRWARVHALGVTVLLCACAAPGGGGGGGAGGGGTIVASEATASNVARVGFLSDYAKLVPVAGGGGVLCWRDAGVNWRGYDKVLIERIQLYLAPGSAQKPIDPSDLKALLDYFHNALVKDLRPQMQVVNTAGPGVLRVRIALTSLVPTNAVDSLVGTAVPYGFVGEIASGAATGRPSGSTPYLGQTGMEAQFRDGATGKVVAECADTEIGRKYAADLNQGIPNAAEKWVGGYLDSFTSWSYAQNAFDKWAAVLALRLRALRTG